MGGPLSGLRAVDFGQYVAGPLAAMILADCGAEVVRVDPPGGPRWRHPANAVLQRGKQSIVLDLHSAEDVESARRLAVGPDGSGTAPGGRSPPEHLRRRLTRHASGQQHFSRH